MYKHSYYKNDHIYIYIYIYIYRIYIWASLELIAGKRIEISCLIMLKVIIIGRGGGHIQWLDVQRSSPLLTLAVPG